MSARFARLGFSLVRPVSCGEWVGLRVAAVVGGAVRQREWKDYQEGSKGREKG